MIKRYSTGKHPRNAADLEILEINRHTVDQHFTLEIIEKNYNRLVISVTDGNNKKHIVDLYSPKIKSCSCAEYCNKELGWCKHLAVVNYLSKHPFSKEEVAFSTELNTAIKHLKEKKDVYYRMWDSYSQKYVEMNGETHFLEKLTNWLGNIPEKLPIDSISVSTKKKIDLKYPKSTFETPVVLDFPYNLTSTVSLYPYQHDILEKMLTAKRAVCSMRMGTGKTLTSIGGMKNLGFDTNTTLKSLIICPKSVAIQWADEIKKVLGKEVIFLSGKNIIDFVHRESCIGICTYQTFSRNYKELAACNYNVIIADEIQFVRNELSKTWSACKKLKSEYFWGLSGTVIENKLDDLYNIVDIICPKLLGPKWKFDQRFKKIVSITKTKIIYSNEVQNLEELRELIKNNVFSYYELDLPDLEDPIDHYVEIDAESRKKHDHFVEQAAILDAKSMSGHLTPAEKMILQGLKLKARQCCNSIELINKMPDSEASSKVKKLLEISKEICIHKNEKLVVYSEWTQMLDIIRRNLKIIGIDSVNFDGSMNREQRAKAIQSFSKDSNIKVFLSSDAGGVGIDGLQLIAHNVLHTELPWNPAKLDQRNARLYRIGQKNKVKVHRLISKNTIESNKIQMLLEDKKQIRMDVLY